jgi:hypothetical protein
MTLTGGAAKIPVAGGQETSVTDTMQRLEPRTKRPWDLLDSILLTSAGKD